MSGRTTDGSGMTGDSLRSVQDERARCRSSTVQSGTMADTRGQEPGVKDAPYTGDLDLESVTTSESLAERLRTVHQRVDKPSLRTLEQLTRHGATRLSRTTVSEMLKGVRPPPKAVMVAFLEVCGVQRDQMEPWLRAWERTFAPGPSPVENAAAAQLRQQIVRLQEDNDRLRRELAHQQPTIRQPRFGELASDEESRDPRLRRSMPALEASRLANRIRELREREFVRLTQSQLGQALGTLEDPLSPAAISAWENPGSGRLPPASRLEAYALLFCTPRSFEGAVHMLSLDELTPAELDRRDELRQELLGLRDRVGLDQGTPSPARAESIWHFRDGSGITLVCDRLPPYLRPPQADPGHTNYVRFAGLADLDALIDIYGAIKAYNPTSRVVITAALDVTQQDVANHLVLIGGRAWNTVMRWFSRIFLIPIKADDPGDRGAIVVHEPDGAEREFKYTLVDGELVEDVGFLVRGENPAAPLRTLTIIGGITTRGVHGAARCFIDPEMRGRNEHYLNPRFLDESNYCIVMRVPVVNKDPLTPDLSIAENRLFEWSNPRAEAI